MRRMEKIDIACVVEQTNQTINYLKNKTYFSVQNYQLSSPEV